jgi:hypothetical protein
VKGSMLTRLSPFTSNSFPALTALENYRSPQLLPGELLRGLAPSIKTQ